MSPASIHGRGKSTPKKTPKQRQQKAIPHVHVNKFGSKTEDHGPDTRAVENTQPQTKKRKNQFKTPK
jgi:hypothetical protein